MLTRIRKRTILAVALAGAAFAALGVTASWSHAAGGRELPASPSWEQGNFGPLLTGVTYRASLVSPTPSIQARDSGWSGTQIVTHRAGKIRYESAAFLGHEGEIDLLTGPAMTLSPAAAIAAPRTRVAHWNFAPYDPPTAVKRWTVAGRRALYFDGAVPRPGAWTLVGSNPPELRVDHDRSLRMAAFSVRGRTVVVVIQAPATKFANFLPVAERLLSSLRFPAS